VSTGLGTAVAGECGEAGTSSSLGVGGISSDVRRKLARSGNRVRLSFCCKCMVFLERDTMSMD
jgi:hypothetical protein